MSLVAPKGESKRPRAEIPVKVSSCIHAVICWLYLTQTRATSHLNSGLVFTSSSLHRELWSMKSCVEQPVHHLISWRNSALPAWGLVCRVRFSCMMNLCRTETWSRRVLRNLQHLHWGQKRSFTRVSGSWIQLSGEERASLESLFLTVSNVMQQGDNNVAHMQKSAGRMQISSPQLSGRQSW